VGVEAQVPDASAEPEAAEASEPLPAQAEPDAPSAIDTIGQLDEDKKQALAKKAEKLQEFLTATLLPHITSGMVRILREKPDDPIRFLAEQLHQRSAESREGAEQRARQRFLELLHEGQ